MKFILLLITLCLFSINLSAAGKMKFLSKYQFNKLDKIEKEYYVKKLYKIVSQFEKKMNRGNKLRASYQFSLPSIFNEAFAKNYNFNPTKNCIVGGHILIKRGGRCSYSHKKISRGCGDAVGNPAGGFECGPIYSHVCVAIKNNGATLSDDCANKAIAAGKFKPSHINVKKFKEYVSQICRGDNLKSDGCRNLVDQLQIQYEVAEQMIENKLVASGSCKEVTETQPNKVGPGRAQVKVNKCELKLLDTTTNTYSLFAHEGTEEELGAFVAALNTNGYLNVPDKLSNINIKDLRIQFKNKKGCGSFPISEKIKERDDLFQVKCPALATTPARLDTSNELDEYGRHNN